VFYSSPALAAEANSNLEKPKTEVEELDRELQVNDKNIARCVDILNSKPH
jgi:hypothetical protein